MTLETLAAVIVVCATALVALRMVLGAKRQTDYDALNRRHQTIAAEHRGMIDALEQRMTQLGNRMQR